MAHSLKTAKEISCAIIKIFEEDGKLLVAGNGGSASMADHFVGELVCTFEVDYREPLPAISLVSNSAILTAWSNDFEFSDVFRRQVRALGRPRDGLVIFSTSGKSENCLRAIEDAKEMGLTILDFPRIGKNTAEIQEYQFSLMHEVCREIDLYYS